MTKSTTQYGKHIATLANGVQQGSTLSPLLFDIIADTLIHLLRTANIRCWFYADDLLIAGSDDETKHAI
jgi:hypothetical protein